MSTQILTELPSIQYTGMDFESVMSELQEIVQNNPKWADNWAEFYSSEAGTMFLQLMSWICDNLTTRQDVMLNEMYLSTANKKKDKIRLLKLIGYQPKLSHAAQVAVNIELSTVSENDVIVTPSFSSTDSLTLRANNITKISGKDTNGDSTTWEFIPIVDGTPDYISGIILTAGSSLYTEDENGNTIYALEGETKYKELTAATAEGPYIDLNDSNISADSIVVYIKSTAKKCQKVTSFVSSEALDSSYAIPYTISQNDDGTIRVQFGNSNILDSDRLLAAGTTVSIFYRTSSGSLGNIPATFLNTQTNFTDSNGNNVSAIVYNELNGFNGTDSEEIDSAVLNAPLSLRTLDRAVTVEDYDILFKSNSSLLKTKTYTASNNPNNFRSVYGRYINPQEAFIFAIGNKDYNSVPSAQYNNFPWLDLYKVPRLNEKYNFENGKNNVEISKSNIYYNLSLFPSGENTKTFNNGIVLDIGADFNSAISENLDNADFKLKITTALQEASYFNNIPYSLLGTNEYVTKNLFTDLSDNVEITVDDNARFITESSYEKELDDEKISCIDIINCRYIIMALDGRTEMVIDLYENTSSGDPNGHYYILWDNEPTGTVPASDSTRAACYNRHGIVQLINSQIVAIANGETSQEAAANVYTANNAYQWLGLQISDPDNVAFVYDEDYQRKDLILTINDKLFKFPFSPNDDELNTTFKGFVAELNNHFQDSSNVKIYEEGFWVDNTYDLSGLTADIVQTSNYSDGDYSYYYDIFIKTEDSSWLYDNTINLAYEAVSATSSGTDEYNGYEFNGLYESFIHTLHDRDVVIDYTTLLGANFEATDYSDLAEMIDDPNDSDYQYLKISSPIKGSFSSIHFKTSEAIEDGYGNFMKNFLGLYFNSQNDSQRAYGQKKIYLVKTSCSGGYKEDITASEYTELTGTLSIGNLIFENSCIYNSYDFSNLYAFYKLSNTNSLVIGSVYDNFYYTGDDDVDEAAKDKLVYLEGTVLDDDGNVDEIKSDYKLKLTTSTVDINSFDAIEDDMDLVRSDRVKITSASLAEEELPNATISFTLDSITDDYIIDADVAGLIGGSNIAKAIKNAILENEYIDENDENVYANYIENIDSVVYTSYSCINQVVMKGLAKNNGKIAFYYPGKFEIQDIKKLYQLFLGTSSTNSDFYKLYPYSTVNSNNIVGLEDGEFIDPTYDEEGNITCEYFYYPSEGTPLEFSYREIVDDVSRAADYYIDYDEANEQYLIVKTDESLFPSSDFYMHFVNDRSSQTDIEIDEKALIEYMDDKKISGMDLYFAKPYFKTYDIKAVISYNANYSESNIKSSVEEAVKETCSLENADIGGYMSQAKIIKAIMACDGVENVTISYFGYDYTSGDDSSTQLDADFYEILSLADYEENKHGALFEYEVQS